MTIHHVYIDYKPNGVPFYVGKGTPDRVKLRERDNAHHTNTCKKYPEWYRVVVETASDDLCKEFEMLLISEIGRKDLKQGTLVNLTDGGEGVSGLKHSEETIKKLSVKTTLQLSNDDSKARWYAANHAPDVQLRRAKAVSLSWEDRNLRDQRIDKMKETKAQLSFRTGFSKLMKEVMNRPEVVERVNTNARSAEANLKRSASLRSTLATEEARAVKRSAATESQNRPEVKQQKSAIMRAFCKTEHGKALKSKMSRGTVWVNNGVKNVRCNPNNIPDGFLQGMLKNG